MRPILLLLIFVVAAVGGEPSIPTPPAIPEGVFAVVVVPDLRATIGRIELAAQALTPGALEPGQLANQIGETIGDPQLANLAAGAILLVVGPGGVAPSTAMIVPAIDATAYVTAAQAMGTKAEAVGSLVVVGQKPADLALGKRVAADHALLSATKVAGDVRVLVAPKRVLTAYKPILGGFTTMIAAQMAKEPNGAQMAKIVGLEIAALLDVADEVDACQTDIRLDGSVVVSATTIQASAASGLAKAFIAPTVPLAAVTRAAKRMGLDPGYMLMVGRYNPQGACAWLADLCERLRQRPEGKELLDESVVGLIRRWGDNLDGAFALRMRAVGEQPMRMDAVTGIRDAARQAGIHKEVITRLFGAGEFGDFYRKMGIDSTYKEKVRAIGGIPVDRLVYRIDPAKMPADQADQMRRFVQDTEFAIVPDALLMANAPADLDRLVAGGADPLPTAAQHAIGAGRDGYLDLDWLGMMKVMMQAVPNANFMAAALAKVPNGEPMTAAWSAREGRLLWESRLPLQPFFDYGRALQAAMMEQFKNNGPEQPEPAAAPPENPEQVF